VLWDPFLMKKLIKSEVYGTRKQYISALFTTDRVNSCGWENKKRKKEKKTQTDKRPIQTAPKSLYTNFALLIFLGHTKDKTLDTL